MLQEDKLPEAEEVEENSEEVSDEVDKKKGWSLEDDDEDDAEEVAMETVETEGAEGPTNGEAPGDDEEDETMEEDKPVEEVAKVEEVYVDPLDAFMVGVQEEVNEIKNSDQMRAGAKLSGMLRDLGAICVNELRV